MAEGLLARSYQMHIERSSTKQNTIIFLPTGSGKTFIAVQLIKRLQKDIQPLYSLGGKRTFFLVNSVVLVEQQVNVLRELTNLKIEGYTSQNKVDLWNISDWLRELEKAQVLVMTAQILVDMLHHNYISLQRINLMVFDECHHAVDKHPMRQLMKHFEGVHKDSQPKVIGLTATLLNKNLKPNQVLKEIRELEKTFNSIICTTDPVHISEVFSYSTNPEEFVIPYDQYSLTKAEEMVKGMLTKLQCVVSCIKIEPNESSPSIVPHSLRMKPPQNKVIKFVKNMVQSLFRYLDDFGMYGSSLSILAYIVLCERLKLSAETSAKHNVLQMTITSLNKARAILERAMVPDTGFRKIHRHSSPKVRQVMEVLKEYSPKVMDSGVPLRYNKFKETLSAMVFVQERFSCKVLSTILNHASQHSEDLAYLKVDFAVGFNLNPFSDTREGLYEKKQNKAVIMKYASHQLNCLVTTEMMEEGMDVPRCTLVLRYDPVVNFRSYVQAKGRGRHKKAVYAMLVSREDHSKFMTAYVDYKNVEMLLNNVLMNNTDDRIVPSKAEMEEKYKSLCPPYVYKDASITMDTSMSLLSRYCNSLPQDKFTTIQPEWFKRLVNGSIYQVTVLLPPFCPHKEPIKGVPLEGLKNAKKAAALKACEILHRAGELTDKLLPRERYDDIDPAVEETFFSHWLQEESTGEKAAPLGTKKNKRIYNKKLPQCLSGDADKAAFPRSYYLHEISIHAVQEAKDENAATIYSLLEEKRGFSLLTQRPLVDLCPFTLYMRSGEVTVDIKINQKCIKVNEPQFEVIKRFHTLVFVDVLGVQKSFMAFDHTLGDNHYLVVPSVGSGDTLAISWDTIATHQSLEPQREPSVDERRATPVDAAHYNCSVVEPWYRAGMETRYIVTKVCEYMTPHSPFCDPSIESFVAYFQMKYKLSLLGSPDQPMLQVRYLSGKMNALLPRSITLAGRNKRKDRNEPKTDEFLVPEFCIRYNFPGLLWLKATLLPSILHRLTMILQAEELRHTIAVEAGLGVPRLPLGITWDPLRVDPHALSHSLHNELALPQPAPPVPMDVDAELAAPETIMREDNYRLSLKKLEQEFPWEVNMEPIDIDRYFDTVTVMDIECFERFVQQKVPQTPVPLKLDRPRGEESIKSARAICAPPYKYVDTIEVLALSPTALGPQLSRVLESLVITKSNDIFNLERLEILGDSFLKFSISLYLLHRYPGYHEGRLTVLKGKIVSNKNLYYCGLEKEIPGRMKVECFTPKSDWLVPAFCVPRPVQELFIEAEVCPSVLYSLDLPRSEILSGQPSSKSWEQLMEAISSWAEAETKGRVDGMDLYLGRQAVQDKVVADSVEALIGVYLLDGGLHPALRLLQWLKVLPTEKENVCDMLKKRMSTALSEGKTDLDQIYFNLDYTVPQIEAIMGYKFKDPSFLLQALSHSSNLRNRITDSYQRLEFLGDAVLDFLVTCHLYERCGTLSPGDLTDMRSALVNNNTLACLTVRLGLHKFIQSSNVSLDAAIAKFVRYQMQREHLIDEGVLFLLQEDDCNLAEYIEVPKALGDILESMVGAIFLDCGGDLATVWKVFYRIMHQEIALFSEKVPKNPVRLLHENIHAAPQFLSSEALAGGTVMIPLQLRVAGKPIVVHGFGKNKAHARRAACKIALRMLDVASC